MKYAATHENEFTAHGYARLEKRILVERRHVRRRYLAGGCLAAFPLSDPEDIGRRDPVVREA